MYVWQVGRRAGGVCCVCKGQREGQTGNKGKARAGMWGNLECKGNGWVNTGRQVVLHSVWGKVCVKKTTRGRVKARWGRVGRKVRRVVGMGQHWGRNR